MVKKRQNHLAQHQILLGLVKFLNFFMYLRVYLFEFQGNQIRMDSAVQKDDSPDFGYRSMVSQPLPVVSIRTQRFAIFRKASRMFCHPLFFHGGQHRLFESCQQLRVARVPSRIFLIRSFPAIRGFAVREPCIVLWGDIAQVAQNIHYLVIAKQGQDLPSRFCRFLFKRHN